MSFYPPWKCLDDIFCLFTLILLSYINFKNNDEEAVPTLCATSRTSGIFVCVLKSIILNDERWVCGHKICTHCDWWRVQLQDQTESSLRVREEQATFCLYWGILEKRRMNWSLQGKSSASCLSSGFLWPDSCPCLGLRSEALFRKRRWMLFQASAQWLTAVISGIFKELWWL